jgi:FMN reductase
MKLVIVVGNPAGTQSRTLAVAEAIADALVDDVAGVERTVIDLAEVAASVFDWNSEPIAGLVSVLADADLAIIASPTYKATYTGLLKAFLDRYGTNGLGGVTAVPVMTGAGPGHAMAPDVYLRTLLVELGASVPTRSVYFTTDKMEDLGTFAADWAAANREALGGLAGFGS